MSKFPADAPKRRVSKALQQLGFRIVREQEHIAMVRDNANDPNSLDSGQPTV